MTGLHSKRVTVNLAAAASREGVLPESGRIDEPRCRNVSTSREREVDLSSPYAMSSNAPPTFSIDHCHAFSSDRVVSVSTMIFWSADVPLSETTATSCPVMLTKVNEPTVENNAGLKMKGAQEERKGGFS